jgi:hypothetical protein
MRGNSRGVKFTDRELAGNVRNLGLKKLKVVLSDDYPDKEYQKQILLRLAPSLLPRLNAGRDEDERLVPRPILSNVFSDNGD